MAIGKVVETRILSDSSSDWQNVCKYAITNKQFLILTPCVNNEFNIPVLPTDTDWQKTILNACKFLKSIGGNYNNCKVSIINEPTKFFRNNGGMARYTHFINLAYPIIKQFDFRTGAGNMEFYDAAVLGDWYRYICINAKFDDLDIHIQGSCDNEKKIKKYTDYALELAKTYNKKLDCTEAFYGNIATQSGWNLLNRQLYHAERIGCANFANVFNDLRTDMFPILKDKKVLAKWTELSFKVNGVLRSNYWAHWKILMDTKAPVPNIPIIKEEDDMKLEKYYYKNKVTYSRDKNKAGVKFIQTVINVKPDGIWGPITNEAVKDYQADFDLEVDGIVGPLTFREMMKTHKEAYVDLQYFVATGEW